MDKTVEMYNGFIFEPITESDVTTLSQIMKKAFDDDVKRNLGQESGGPPGYDNGDFIRKWYFGANAKAYKISKDNVVIGAINVFVNKDGENYLGNMFIDPNFGRQGAGRAAWQYVEQKFADTKKWSTDTPGFSKSNHAFYVNKCGFAIVRIENSGNEFGGDYIMEKIMEKPCSATS